MTNEPCLSCGGNYSSYSPPPNSIQPCSQVPGTCQQTDSSCSIYTGARLFCIGVDPNNSVELILQKLDEKICSMDAGDWSGFNYHCLTDDVTITSASEFVNQMTLQFCNLQTSYTTFTGTTYVSDKANLQAQITSILSPGLTLCAGSGVTSSDTYTSILTKLANNYCTLASVDYTTANWRQCFTVPTLPTTVIQGFNTVLDQICQVKASITTPVLPTFNNQGSCLATPGTNDTLVDTINKIKDRLCQGVVYDINSTNWSCISQPADFQGVINSLVEEVQTLISNDVVFDNNVFAVTTDGCNGRTVTLQEDFAGTDRLVASDSADTTPGTLADKLAAGSNITLSNVAVAGKIQINATVVNDQVKTNPSDTSGYLTDKVTGDSTNGVTIAKTVAVDNSHIILTPSLDFSYINTQWFDAVENDPDLYARFCTLICGCKPCQEGTTPPTTSRRFKIRITNNSSSKNSVNRYTVFQNNPVLGWMDDIITVPSMHTYESGWYDVTSTTPTLTANVQITDTVGTSQNLNVRVLQPGNTIIPGASSYIGALGGGYTNSSFSLGNLNTDIVLEIQIS